MQLSFAIAGMHCESCVATVRTALEQIDSVEIDHVDIGSALVKYDEAKTSKNELLAAVRKAGSFEITSFKTDPN